MIRDLVNSGLARAKARGKVLGRPKINPVTEEAIRKALTTGKTGIGKIVALQTAP